MVSPKESLKNLQRNLKAPKSLQGTCKKAPKNHEQTDSVLWFQMMYQHIAGWGDGAIKNPSTDGFNSVKLSFPQLLLCCEEGSDVILVDDLLQCLDSGAVSDNAHDAVLCYLAHGSDLCCHAACAEP